MESIESLNPMPTEHDLGFRWQYLRPASVFTYHIGKIAIDYQGGVHRIGSGLKTAEAIDIVNQIIRFKFPIDS